MPCTEYKISFNSGLTIRNVWLKKSTGEQNDFNSYLDLNPNKYIGKTCLHVGTGNSSIAINHHNKFKRIDGITVEPGEVSLANNLMIPNYTCYLINKYKLEELSVLGEYDVIIDNNIKTLEQHNYVIEAQKSVESTKEYKPTKKGIAVNPKILPEVVEMMVRAAEEIS